MSLVCAALELKWLSSWEDTNELKKKKMHHLVIHSVSNYGQVSCVTKQADHDVKKPVSELLIPNCLEPWALTNLIGRKAS